MSKKVLLLSVSPRKGGNSDLICDQFMLGAKEAGNQADKQGIIYGIGVWKVGDINGHPAMKQAYEMGKSV